MPKTYSLDLRERVLQKIEEGKDAQEVSKLFSIGIATVYRWIQRKKIKGTLEPTKRPYAYRKIDYDKLEEYVGKHPDHFLYEIAEHFNVTEQAIFYALKKLKITLKKRRHSTSKEIKKKG